MKRRDRVSPLLRCYRLLSVIVLTVSSSATRQVAAQARTVTAFVDVSVVPMDREQVLSHQTVVVQEGRITALGPASKVVVPTGATRVDGRGKFLLPGLTDMHAHVSLFGRGNFILDAVKSSLGSRIPDIRRQLFFYLANGVTTIRLMRSWSEALDLRAQAAAGTILSPRLYVAADPLTDKIPSSDSFAAIVRYVESAKQAGYDLLKIYGENGSILDTIVAAARRVDLPIAGHPPYAPSDDRSIDAAIRAGFTSIEHLIGLGWSEAQTRAQLQANARKLKQAGVWVCPTLFHINDQDFANDYPEFRYFKDLPRTVGAHRSPLDLARDTVRNNVVKTLHELGVGLLLGSDAGSGPIWGFTTHRELAALVTAGLRPYDALVTGTKNPAIYFSTLDSTGTVAVGKRADLLLLSGNPLVDIRHTAHPAGVMMGGRWLPREELDQILALLEGTLDLM